MPGQSDADEELRLRKVGMQLDSGAVDPSKNDWRARRDLILGRIDARTPQERDPGYTGSAIMGASQWANFFNKTSPQTQTAALQERMRVPGLPQSALDKGISQSVLDGLSDQIDRYYGRQSQGMRMSGSPAEARISRNNSDAQPDSIMDDLPQLTLGNITIGGLPKPVNPSASTGPLNAFNFDEPAANPWPSMTPKTPTPFSYFS